MSGARCGLCEWTSTLTDAAGLKAWRGHYMRDHHDQLQETVVQLPNVDWHTQALTAIRALAATGQPFVISQIIDYGVPDAPNPRTDYAKVQGEAVDFGWIEQTGRLGRSTRPTTKGSPVAEWIGTYAARRGAA